MTKITKDAFRKMYDERLTLQEMNKTIYEIYGVRIPVTEISSILHSMGLNPKTKKLKPKYELID